MYGSYALVVLGASWFLDTAARRVWDRSAFRVRAGTQAHLKPVPVGILSCFADILLFCYADKGLVKQTNRIHVTVLMDPASSTT